MRKITKAIRKHSFWVILPLAVIAIMGLMSVFHVQYIATDSMNPIMPRGTILIDIPTDHVAKGDVITFHESEGSIVTHRVYAVNSDGTIITKGDASFSVDSPAIPLQINRVVGKVLFNQGVSWVTILVWIAVASVILLMGYMLFKVTKQDDEVKEDETVDELSLSK